MNKNQAEALVGLSGFEIDMSFKGTVGEVNEWEIASYDRKAQMTLTYARVFTNSKTAEAYMRIFDNIAEVIREHTNSYPRWRHIHNEGWAYVLADMDPAQAKGLGMHLSKIDPTRNADEHLQHILVSCLVHFHRALHSKRFSDEVKDIMKKIPFIVDKETLNLTLDRLRMYPEKEIHNWLEFYTQLWLLSSLSPAKTKMPLDIFCRLSRTTNAIESNHANANWSGKQMTLHATVFR